MKNLVFNKFGNIATTVKNLDKTITEKVNNKKKAPKPPYSQTAPTPITKEDLKNIPLDDEELKATKIQTIICSQERVTGASPAGSQPVPQHSNGHFPKSPQCHAAL